MLVFRRTLCNSRMSIYSRTVVRILDFRIFLKWLIRYTSTFKDLESDSFIRFSSRWKGYLYIFKEWLFFWAVGYTRVVNKKGNNTDDVTMLLTWCRRNLGGCNFSFQDPTLRQLELTLVLWLTANSSSIPLLWECRDYRTTVNINLGDRGFRSVLRTVQFSDILYSFFNIEQPWKRCNLGLFMWFLWCMQGMD